MWAGYSANNGGGQGSFCLQFTWNFSYKLTVLFDRMCLFMWDFLWLPYTLYSKQEYFLGN